MPARFELVAGPVNGLLGDGVKPEGSVDDRFLVVPAACLLAILLVISLPLGVMTLGVFAITLYLAKLPVALWIGERILASVGRPGASPFLALAIGLVLLYLVFAIPFYVGFLLKLAATWLGLGTIILTRRNRTQPPETPAAAG